MHLQLDEERSLVRESVRAFAREQVRPNARAWDEAARIDARVLDAAWNLGTAQLGAGPSYGGAAESDDAIPSALTNAVVLEELAWADLAFALSVLSPLHAAVPLLLGGHEALKREIVPTLLSSTTLPRATGAWVEPTRTFDVRSMSTRATSSPQGPTLFGKKTLAPRADDSDITVVVAKVRADDDASAFEPFVLLGRNVTGLVRSTRNDVIGARGTPLVDLALDDANARPLAARVGETHARLEERVLVASAAAAVGVARAATELAVDYARERRAFGRAIGQNQGIAFPLAEHAMDTEAARWLTWKAAWSVDKNARTGASSLVEASRAFRFATDLAWRASDTCVQVLGGHGVIRDHLAELFFRNSRTLARTPGWFMV